MNDVNDVNDVNDIDEVNDVVSEYLMSFSDTEREVRRKKVYSALINLSFENLVNIFEYFDEKDYWNELISLNSTFMQAILDKINMELYFAVGGLFIQVGDLPYKNYLILSQNKDTSTTKYIWNSILIGELKYKTELKYFDELVKIYKNF